MDARQIERVLALDAITKNIVRNVVAKDELPTKIGACRTAFVCTTHDADKPSQTGSLSTSTVTTEKLYCVQRDAI